MNRQQKRLIESFALGMKDVMDIKISKNKGVVTIEQNFKKRKRILKINNFDQFVQNEIKSAKMKLKCFNLIKKVGK